jgi:hypothetical protein
MSTTVSRLGATLLALSVLPLGSAGAIPAFARKYHVSCALCHSPPPRLNSFGENFAANGFELAPGEEPRDTIGTGDGLLRLPNSLPIAVRYDAFMRTLTRPDALQNSPDFQTPWVIKLLSGGQVAEKVSYYMYFLLNERGAVGGLEDAFIQFTDLGGSGVSLLFGQFQVSDPLFKRELRLEYDDYVPYKLRVGTATPNLTYDRGLMALYSPWDGADMALELVAGRGLNEATGQQYDGDDAKSTFLRFSQAFGVLRVGAFGYRGTERSAGSRNTTTMWGPDATLDVGTHLQLNAQYLRRLDRDPFFGSCSVAEPCPGGAVLPFGTTVDAAFAEAVVFPQGPAGRLFLTGLVNWAHSDRPVYRLDGEEYFSRYRSVSVGAHVLYRRNLRLMSEVGHDLETSQTRFVVGSMIAF